MKPVNRFIIRAGNHSLSFLKPLADGGYQYLPYVSKSGMSVSANLRAAFREEEFFNDKEDKAALVVCTPVSLVPLDEYMDSEEFDASEIYDHTFTKHEHEAKVCNVLPDLDAVAVFGVNKDLKLVVDDNFRDVRIVNVMQPVWEHFYRRSQLNPMYRKLYGYFHDGVLDVFSFQQRRFKYSNSFPVAHAHDALYFLLFVWKQLAFNNETDELHLVGNMPHKEWLQQKLGQFLRKVFFVNPVADLNRAPVSQIKNIDFDMMLI